MALLEEAGSKMTSVSLLGWLGLVILLAGETAAFARPCATP
ncbi:hypothetical protein Ga0609869_002411 [Rhodovulum iodosum]|uniref:Uncharacterized protein n=1 Tax=Rhodovulum iodosum TaxID=68291 RepID=A0ABV3XXN2_9RHOB|nr:hypothetical protein [Rhodovulum robiginosum]